MTKYLLFFCFLLSIQSCSSQGVLMNVSADNISIYLKKSDNNPGDKWDEIKKKPSGSFTCQEEGNGDLAIRYYPKDTVIKFINAKDDDNVKGSLDKLPQKLSSLKFKGVYLNKSEPMNIYHAIYYNSNDPNSLCIVTFSTPDASVVGAVYYSDKLKNPLKEAGIKL